MKINEPITLINRAITVVDTDNDVRTLKMSQDGRLEIIDASSGLALAAGFVSGQKITHKFGKAPLFDIADGFATIWDGSNSAGLDIMTYVYSTTAAINRLSSSDNSNNQQIEITGLDFNFDLVVQTITLNGQTKANLTTNLIRVFRLINIGTTDIAGNVYCFEDDTVTAGVPDDLSLVRAMIRGENNQTLMAVFTVPNGYVGFLRNWFVSTAGARKTSVHQCKLRVRPENQVFQVKHDASIIATGTSHINHVFHEPKRYESKTDIELVTNTDEDAASVSGGFDIILFQIGD